MSHYQAAVLELSMLKGTVVVVGHPIHFSISRLFIVALPFDYSLTQTGRSLVIMS